MPQPIPRKMQSINIQLNPSAIRQLDRMKYESRSQAIRVILSAILEAQDRGDEAPIQLALDRAAGSSAPIRRALTASGKLTWKKTIVWIPGDMFDALQRASSDAGLRVADLIRGAILGMFDIDAQSMLSSEGHEAWSALVET